MGEVHIPDTVNEFRKYNAKFVNSTRHMPSPVNHTN